MEVSPGEFSSVPYDVQEISARRSLYIAAGARSQERRRLCDRTISCGARGRLPVRKVGIEMAAATRAAECGSTQGSPEELEIAFAIAMGNALELKAAAIGAMSDEKIAERNAITDEAELALVATPRTQPERRERIIAQALPVRTPAMNTIAAWANHYGSTLKLDSLAGRIGSFVDVGKQKMSRRRGFPPVCILGLVRVI